MLSFFIVTHLNSKFHVYQGHIQKILNFHKTNVKERHLYTHEVSYMLLKYIFPWVTLWCLYPQWIHQSTKRVS